MKALDLVANVSDMLGWGDVDTIEGNEDASVRKILRHTNLVLKSMQAERAWKELDVKATMLTQAPMTGILGQSPTLLYGSTTINPDDSVNAIGEEHIGAMFNVEGEAEWYKITGISVSGDVEISRPYIGPGTAVEGDSFRVARDTYQLPLGYDRISTKRMRCHETGASVDLAESTEVDMDRESGLVMQAPTKFSIRGRTVRGKPTILFNYVPDAVYSYSYSYQMEHPALVHNTDEILYPERYALAIVDQITARLNSEVEDQQKAMASTQAALSEKVKQGASPDSGEPPPRIAPWTGRGRSRR